MKIVCEMTLQKQMIIQQLFIRYIFTRIAKDHKSKICPSGQYSQYIVFISVILITWYRRHQAHGSAEPLAVASLNKSITTADRSYFCSHLPNPASSPCPYQLHIHMSPNFTTIKRLNARLFSGLCIGLKP